MTITAIQIFAGDIPWTQARFKWAGSSMTWTLRDVDRNKVVYTGPDEEFLLDVAPQQLYRFELSGDASSPQPAAYVTPPLPAPGFLTVSDAYVTATSAELEWSLVPGAGSYEIGDAQDGYAVLATVAGGEGKATLTGLEPMSTRVIAIRTVLGTAKSIWSPPVAFTTRRSGVASPGYYLYHAASSAVWSSSGGWRSRGTPAVHGSGAQFGDSTGINTTMFFFSADDRAAMASLAASELSEIRVFISRFEEVGDPRMIMSHWWLHGYASPPPGAPTLMGDGVDVGTLMLGEEDWFVLPAEWARKIVSGEAAGIAWGGVGERYMLASRPEDQQSTAARNGSLRIMVM